MSDVMFYGVLRMPYEMAMSDDLSRLQFWGRAQEAADRVEHLEKEVSGLRAAMIAYANEFPPNEDGEPDVGNIHANIRKLRNQLRTAVYRLEDLLREDDGHAFKEARKSLPELRKATGLEPKE